MEKTRRRERKTAMSTTTTAEEMEVEVASSSIDGALIFRIVSDVLAFLLYMHQQIPSLLQDMTFEFNSLQTEYKELDIILTQGELNAASRRMHSGRKRDIKMGIRRMEKLMSTISGIETALQLMIQKVPNVEHVVFVFGASPRRPHHVYEIRFPHGTRDPLASDDMTKSRAIELLSRKIIRALISKGVGSASYPGPSKLFLLVKAPTSFNMPVHFLPKRDFQYAKKIVPFKVQLRSRTDCQELGTCSLVSETMTPFNLTENYSTDEIWFQCRHVIKGLAIGNPSPEE